MNSAALGSSEAGSLPDGPAVPPRLIANEGISDCLQALQIGTRNRACARAPAGIQPEAPRVEHRTSEAPSASPSSTGVYGVPGLSPCWSMYTIGSEPPSVP